MGTVGLHDLIGSVAGAIVDAQGLVENRYIALIRRYFDDHGRPVSIDVKVPRAPDTNNPLDYTQLAVPLLSIVESNMLAIQHLKIDLDVELGSLGLGLPDPGSGMDAASADAPVAAGDTVADPAATGGAPFGVAAMATIDPPAAAPVEGYDGPPSATPPLAAASVLTRPTRDLSVGIGGRSDTSGPTARLSIVVKARPPSEALLRLVTQLNKVV